MKVTASEQVWLVPSDLPVQVLLTAVNSAAFVPVIIAAPSGPLGDPVLVTTNVNDVTVVPTATEPKLKLDIETDSAAVDGVPVPEIAASTVPPGLAVTSSHAVAEPVTVGVNVTVHVHPAPPEST